MIKKIVHIADLHIRTYAMHDLYKAQFDKLLKEIGSKFLEWADENISHNEIRIVIAGDIAHQKINISNEQLLLTTWFLKELTSYGKVIIIPGNHDFLENNHERLDSITPVVELLNNDNTISFSHISYQPKSFKTIFLKQNDTIFLTPITRTLNDVVVSSNTIKDYLVLKGFYRSYLFIFLFFLQHLNAD